MYLSDLKTGEKGIIVKVNGSGAFRKRILEMGFIKGKTVTVILNAPLKDPIKYKIMDYEVSLRRSESRLIEVIYPQDTKVNKIDKEENLFDKSSSQQESALSKKEANGRKEIVVALVGNPNAGKTSLFNIASGAHEHVGNYGGVTVDSKEGKFKHKDYTFRIIDLPGTYSISAYTPEELYVRKFIVDEKPDVIINVVAASNLERNLYLTTELIDMMVPMVIDLNMYDELLESGSELDHKKLSELIGIPIIPTVSKTGMGIPNLFDAVIRVFEDSDPVVKRVRINYGNTVENAISRLNIKLDKLSDKILEFPQRYISIKLLEKDADIERYIKKISVDGSIIDTRNAEVRSIEETLSEDTESAITNARYGYITGALKETFKEKLKTSDVTRILDAIVTNKYWGFPLFFFFMWVMFECTFTLGEYPMGWIESGVGWLSDLLRGQMSEGMLKDLLIDGIIGGVGGVQGRK